MLKKAMKVYQQNETLEKLSTKYLHDRRNVILAQTVKFCEAGLLCLSCRHGTGGEVSEDLVWS